MKYQTFTDTAGRVLFSIVVDDDSAPFEIEGVFGLDIGENDFSLGFDLSSVSEGEPRYEEAQRHLQKIAEHLSEDSPEDL